MRYAAIRRRWIGGPDSTWCEAQKEAAAPVKSPCRICHSLGETRDDPLVAPCHCDGSLRYVHNSCQQAWLSHRQGPLTYSCELCRSKLTCRLTLATRLEVSAVCTTSAVVWAVQVDSVARMARLALRLLAARWRQGGASRLAGAPALPGGALLRGAARLLPPASAPVAGCEALARGAALHLALAAGTALLAHGSLAACRRPLVLLGEDALSRLCIVKIGGCVLVLLHEALWAFPPVQCVAPLPAWHAIGMTLVLDTLLLAFFRIPREDRGIRVIVPRVALAACRLTADFLPFAAVFFLWSASIVMIMAASLVPCLALLFHEAIRDVRRRRHRHGSVQMALLVLRAAARLTLLGMLSSGAGSRVWGRCDQAAATAWLAAEAAVLWDLFLGRRGACCAREVPSQALWTLAVAGQTALVALDRIYGLGPARAARASGFHGGSKAGGVSLPGLLPQRLQGESPAAPPVGAGLLGSIVGSSGGAAAPGAQEAALLLCLAAYSGIHAGVFAGWAIGAKRAAARALACVEPDRVVFYDCPHHRSP